MSLLEASTPDDLVKRLGSMSAVAVKKQEDQVKALLNHRAILVRWAASHALGKSRIGADELRGRLLKEKNSVVITEITEALVSLRDKKSLPQIRHLAESHSSLMVRIYSILAVADIEGKASIPYLQSRRSKEKSPRVRAALSCALLAKGSSEAISDVLSSLKSKDSKVRDLVANLLHHYSPRKGRAKLVAGLLDALKREELTGVRGDIERALQALSAAMY